MFRFLVWLATVAVGLCYLTAPALASVSTECNQYNLQNCIDGVGSGMASLGSLRAILEVETSASDDLQYDRGQASLGDRLQSQATDDGFSEWSVWGGYSNADLWSITRVPYEATLNNFVIGADTLFTNQLLLGAFASYEGMDVDTTFNGDSQSVDAMTLGP